MDQETSPGGQEVTHPAHPAGDPPATERTPEQVQREIEQTRAELGDTVAELAAKADVKANVAAKANEVKESVTAKRDRLTESAKAATPQSAGEAGERVAATARQNRTPLIVAGALGAGVLIGMRLRR